MLSSKMLDFMAEYFKIQTHVWKGTKVPTWDMKKPAYTRNVSLPSTYSASTIRETVDHQLFMDLVMHGYKGSLDTLIRDMDELAKMDMLEAVHQTYKSTTEYSTKMFVEGNMLPEPIIEMLWKHKK